MRILSICSLVSTLSPSVCYLQNNIQPSILQKMLCIKSHKKGKRDDKNPKFMNKSLKVIMSTEF